MGDAILSTPALRLLRAKLPGDYITFLAAAAVQQVLEGNPWCDQWVTVAKDQESAISIARQLRRYKFDAAILLANSFRSALWTRLAGIKKIIGYNRDGRGGLLTEPVELFRLDGRIAPISMIYYYGWLVDKAAAILGGGAGELQERLELFTSEQDSRRVDELLTRWGITPGDKIIILVPGGGYGPSKWWPAVRFAELAERFMADGYKVVISCAPNERERSIAEAIQTRTDGKTFNLLEAGLELAGLKELDRRSSLMVSNDTGPCHIAAAFGVKLVTIFGPTDPRWTATGYAQEIRLRNEVDCRPCQQETCRQDHRCLESITVQQVYRAAGELLAGQVAGRNSCSRQAGYYQPFAEDYVPSSDGCGLVHKDFKDILVRERLAGLEEVFACQKGAQLRKPGLKQRERIKLDLTADDGRKITVYLKRFGPAPLGEVIKSFFNPSRGAAAGVNDFASAMALAERGVATARPISYGQEPAAPGRGRSFVILQELPQAEALERLLPQWQEKKNSYAMPANKKELIGKLAELVGRLHREGFCHRDLYLSHIFLCKSEAGQERLCLIDLQRVFEPKFRRRRWQIKDLAQLYYSGRAFFSRADMLRFLREYARITDLPDADRTLARAVWRKAQRIARHDRKKQQSERP